MSERAYLYGIRGPMFSGKSTELLRQSERLEFSGKKVLLFKPDIDVRWGKQAQIATHSGSCKEAIAIPTDIELINFLDFIDGKTNAVAFDEIQFFGPEILIIIDELLERGIEVHFAGLPLDFRGEDFGQMPKLLALADYITPLTAICRYKPNGEICGKEATRTQRIVNGKPANYCDPIILIGASEKYEARCPKHHIVLGKPNNKK